MHVDVDRWAIERRDELAELFRKCGTIPRGAMVLLKRDPRTSVELAVPETLSQSSDDYESYQDFLQGLRIHCLRCDGLGVVMFGEGLAFPEAPENAPQRELVERARAGEAYPALTVIFACRGRMQAKLWTARIGGHGELGGFVESTALPHEKELIFPITN